MKTNWRKSLQVVADVAFEQKTDGTVKIDVTTPPELQSTLSEPRVDDGIESDALKDGGLKDGQADEPVIEQAGSMDRTIAPPVVTATSSVDPRAVGVEATRGSVVLTKGKKVKEWVMRKEGKLSLVGRECGTHVEVSIERGGESLESFRIVRQGRTWRELINQASWESRFEKYLKSSK